MIGNKFVSLFGVLTETEIGKEAGDVRATTSAIFQPLPSPAEGHR